MRLYLVRHPPPAVAAGTCYGRTDLPLAADPAACAGALRALLPADAPLYSSPLLRCRRLAELLHPAPVIDARLRELDFGEWEMQRWDAIDRAALDAWAGDPLGFAPPGGEAVADLRLRVADFLAQLPDEAVLIGHAGVMKLCAAELAGVPAATWFAMRFDYGTATLIEDGRLVWQNRSHA
jgi:alpha-ribazole phosphatase